MLSNTDQRRRSPAHAGRLRLWERCTIALLFVGAAAIIVGLSVPFGHQHPAPPRTGGKPQANRKAAHAPGRSASGSGWSSAVLTGPGSIPFQSAAAADDRLAAALAPVLRHRSGSLAAGVVDATTPAVAALDGDRVFRTAGVVQADILAGLLFEHQQMGTALSGQQRTLAKAMIENGSGQAASDLWTQVGRAVGLRYANQQLGLLQTAPASGASWGLTGTTVDDQLRLLAVLASAHSALSAASRSYELSLMRHLAPGQTWGVTAAAAPGTAWAISGGSRSGGSGATWVVNSIGVVPRGGHVILVAILSSGQASEAAGIAEVDAAAKAAVGAIEGGQA